MKTRKLTLEEFNQTFSAPMRNVTATAEPKLDIWPYVEAVPIADLERFTLLDEVVAYVYLAASQQYEHVLVATNDKNVFLVIIVNLSEIKIEGHILLDLAELYGLR